MSAWTTKKPTVSGWYWVKMKYRITVKLTILRVRSYTDGACYVYANKPVERCEYEWQGPISPQD